MLFRRVFVREKRNRGMFDHQVEMRRGYGLRRRLRRGGMPSSVHAPAADHSEPEHRTVPTRPGLFEFNVLFKGF